MSKRDEMIKSYLTHEEKAKFVEMADRADKSQSELLREAVLEYLDRDRTARVEDQLRELNDKVDALQGDLRSQEAHTRTDLPEALVNTRNVIERLQENNKEVVNDGDVERAIEDYVGMDPRTIKKYKSKLRERGLLFEHPGERPLWTFETDVWKEWAIQYATLNGGETALENVVESYPATVTRGFDDELMVEVKRDTENIL